MDWPIMWGILGKRGQGGPTLHAHGQLVRDFFTDLVKSIQQSEEVLVVASGSSYRTDVILCAGPPNRAFCM